jgi:hypothetical protein
MLKLFSFFNNSFKHKHPVSIKPSFSLESSFELDPAEFLAEFCQKIKSLDGNNWIINDNLGKGLFDLWFLPSTVIKYSELTTVWNSKKINIKYYYTYIDGFQTDIFEFFHNDERILTLQKIKDYGKNFHNYQKNIAPILPSVNLFDNVEPLFLQNRYGDGILLEKFGHTQRWWIEDWFTVRQFLMVRTQTS